MIGSNSNRNVPRPQATNHNAQNFNFLSYGETRAFSPCPKEKHLVAIEALTALGDLPPPSYFYCTWDHLQLRCLFVFI